MNRSFLAMAVALLFTPTARTQPTEGIAYGDTPQFWESHALVIATVDAVRHGENGPDHVKSDVSLTLQESVPGRYASGTRFSITFLKNWRLGPVRDKPVGAIYFKSGDRLMLMMTEEKGRMVPALPQVMDSRLLKALNANKEKGPLDLSKPLKPITYRGYESFAMLPTAFKLHFPKEDDAIVAETVRVCQALSEKEVTRRLELIAAIQKAKPSDRVQDLLRRRLETTLETSIREAQGAMRLLKETRKK